MIYTNLNNSGEVEAVYAAKRVTTTGLPPLSYPSKGYDLEDFLISGNTIQGGTPTPEAPVDVQGVGARTRNLFDYQTMEGTVKGYYLDSEGALQPSELVAVTDYIPCSGGSFTLNKVGGINPSICLYDENKQFLYGKAYNTSRGEDKQTIIVDTSFNASFIRFTYFYRSIPIDDLSAIMLNTGSTPLPWEPYGYKIPISSGGRNLFNATVEQGTITIGGNIPANNCVRTKEYINVESNYITLSWDSSQNTEVYIMMYDANGDYVSGDNWRTSPTTYQLSSTIKKIRIIWRYNSQVDISPSAITNIMLNTGSIPLPYEPYNRITTPIYLGEAQTTRKIKKLVLTGTENVDLNTVNKNRLIIQAVYTLPQTGTTTATNIICSHLKTLSTAEETSVEQGITMRYNGTDILFGIPFSLIGATTEDSNTTIRAKVKSYLAAQYSAGTPVTVWYVLADPETGIVNEPLHKISDYADTLSLSQSGITVPTTAGTNTITTDTTVLPSSISVTTPEKEVEEIYAGINYQNPVYYKSRTLTGTLPLTYESLGQPLKDYNIGGNTIQNGTPTPAMPVDVVGCGVRTENLLEITDNIKNSTEWELSPLLANRRYFMVYDITKVIPRGIISANVFENFEPGYEPGMLVCAITPENTATVDQEYRILNNNGVITPKTFDTTSWNTVYLCIGYGNSFYSESEKQQKIDELFNNWRIMINEGSTPLPYGYKLPLTINGTEYPIYLGQVETTRRIKKLVLTGKEPNWNVGVTGLWHLKISDIPAVTILDSRSLYCTHYNGVASKTTYSDLTNGNACIYNSIYIWIRDPQFNSLTAFKSYLAAQYAVGTPVTVWYVLAEPETGIVNEPLMKISDYVDTISMVQAGVTIPTVAGSNAFDMISTVKPSAVSITSNIKPTGYGQLLDVNNVDIQDKNNTPIFIRG